MPSKKRPRREKVKRSDLKAQIKKLEARIKALEAQRAPWLT